MEIKDTLTNREQKYGEFSNLSRISQELKNIIDENASLEDDKKEALEMICHKIARILNGDSDYVDNWHDIAGYATLIQDRLVAKVNKPSN